ncbi:hypothetical protein AX16_011038 [Volvariella volvacea WC 439]|nr:hypothetical protein AX16_011038 [Volvariella volvacea WC 439]
MFRPELVQNTGSQAKFEVPPGWFVTINAVSRKTYNQLITCDFEIQGKQKSHFMVNKWGQPNAKMRDLITAEDAITILPHDKPIIIELNVYFSTAARTKGEALKADRYRSSRLNVVGNQLPPNAPKGFTDHSTFIIFVEDAPAAAQAPGAPGYGDSLITLNMFQGEVPPLPSATGSHALSQTGKNAIQEFLDLCTNPTKSGPIVDPVTIIPPPVRPPSPYPVCIIGAGVSGLYIAMMLDSLGIEYELMEGSGRTGGRLHTHYFQKKPGKYQYYDVGAMRYPRTTFMARTFELVEKRLGIAMIPYLRKQDNAFLSYNNISITKAESCGFKPGEDIFKVSLHKDGYVPQEWLERGSGYFWEVILGEMRKLFVDHPFPVAFEKLKAFEDHSVTSYLLLEKKIPFPVVKWWETVESRTGLFDLSLVETVLASLVFMDPNVTGEVDWRCFDGGSEVLHKAMTERISTQPQHYMRVTAIKETDNGQSLTVTFDSSHSPRPYHSKIRKKYSQVISTMSLACLRMVDLDELYLSYGQRNAIRQLTYTPSIKIGIQFRTAWWEKLGIVGGQSSTDRPIRDVVYPSYGPDDSHPGSERSNCIIASYNGMQDSQRLGGLMNGRDSPGEKVMLDLVMRDLAAVHQVDVEMLWDEFEDYFPWDFYRDEFQLGAFCQFGPNQFRCIYPYVTQPASRDQRFHFAGDATSTFHG